jgi:hypothetical protein
LKDINLKEKEELEFYLNRAWTKDWIYYNKF